MDCSTPGFPFHHYLSNSVRLWTMPCRTTQGGRVMVESSDGAWSTGEENGKPLLYSCLESPMNRMKRQQDRTLLISLCLTHFMWQHMAVVVVVQSLSRVWVWLLAHQPFLSFIFSQSLLTHVCWSVMPFNRLILCHLLFLLPSIFPRIRIFSSELVLHIRWPKYWETSASASVLPINIQGWSPLGLTGLIVQSKGLSRVFSNTTVQKHQFFGAQLSL